METNKQGLSQTQYQEQTNPQEINQVIKIKLEKTRKRPSSFASLKPNRSVSRMKSVKKLKVLKTTLKPERS